MWYIIVKEMTRMYSIEDLFDKRELVGAKLEQILEDKSYTKIKFCKESGLSRPTLDKLLSGNLTSKTNYEKHISKALKCLSLTPDMLLSRISNIYSQFRMIRNIRKIATSSISEDTGISEKRLKEIESGATATNAELRDIALALGISLRILQGTNFFESQIATLNDFVRLEEYADDMRSKDISGFWGHIGIHLSNTDNYMWFPISGHTRKTAYQLTNEKYFIVPCMNNKLLFINLQNIDDFVLLDEACDQPGNINWDYHVDCGEIPLVVYDALEYFDIYNSKIDNAELSNQFYERLNNFVKEKNWSEDDIFTIVESTTLYHKDGYTNTIEIDFNQYETISSTISDIYSFGETNDMERMLTCTTIGGMDYMINIDNIAMIELPLLKTENAICESFDML